MTKEELADRVRSNHDWPISGNEALYEKIGNSTKRCALDLVDFCPVGRELSLALTAMEEAMFWANAAVARVK